MYKRIISFLLSFLILSSACSAIASDAQITVYISDGYTSYAENQENAGPLKVSSGIDTRIINDNGNKVLFSRAYIDDVILKASIPENDENVTVMSAKLKFTGENFTGKLFTVSRGTKKISLLSISEDGSLALYDGKKIGGIDRGRYHTYTIVTNWQNQYCDFYIDQKCVASRWFLPLKGSYQSPDTIEFSVNYIDSEINVYVDDVRAYAGNTLPWNIKFPAEKSNTEKLDFVPTQNINEEVKIISNITFNKHTRDISISKKSGGGIVTHFADENTNAGYAKLLADEKSVDGSYFDVTPDLKGASQYVVDFRFKVNTLTGSAVFHYFDTKNESGKWRIGYDAKSNGAITSSTAGNIAKYSLGVWNRFSVAYNIPAGTAAVYINGTFACSHEIPSDYYPNIFRFDIRTAVGSNFDVDIDWIRIYTGRQLMSDELFEVHEEDISGSIMDYTKETAAALNGNAVFMLSNNTMYIDGQKKSFADESCKPYIIDGTMMMPLEMLSMLTVDEITYDKITGTIKIGDTFLLKRGETLYTENGLSAHLPVAPVEKSGILYFPLRSVSEDILSKNVLWDDRGFVVISDEIIEPYSGVPYLDRFFVGRPIDLIYRYMQYDNPTGKQIIEDIKANYPNNGHPRIYITKENAEYMLNKISSDNEWKQAYDNLIEAAEIAVNKDYTVNAALEDDSKQMAAQYWQRDIQTLALAYALTGDDRYATQGVESMKIFAQWETMGYNVAQLTSGHWAAGMGIGFDAFYNYMNSSLSGRADMQYIKERILALTFADHYSKYTSNDGPGWVTMQDNFLGVIGGGLLTLGLAVADEEDMQEVSGTILSSVLKSLQIAAGLFYPDGGYFESVSYSSYMLENFMIGLEALVNCCGTDYGFGSAKGFADAGTAYTYLQSTHTHINYHDGYRGYKTDFVREFMAYLYGVNLNHAELSQTIKTLMGRSADLKTLFYYDKAITDKNIAVDIHDIPLDAYVKGAEAGGFISSREISAPTFVGFHGGRTNLPHDMLDVGQFVFASDGIEWVIDLGGDDYNLPGYFNKNGYKLYRKRPEGENCIVLNPQIDVENYYGQNLNAYASLKAFEANKPLGAYAALDLSEAYARDAEKYIRGYYFGDSRNTLTVQDELTLKSNTELYWFMHTEKNINIIDKTHAKLTDESTGKTLTVEVYCNAADFTLKEMPAEPLSTSPKIPGQNENVGYKKLAIHIPEISGDVVISVKLSPDNGSYTQTPLKYMPISQWTVPDGELPNRPVLSGIFVDGKLIDGFLPGKYSYTIDLPYGTTKVPQITATADTGTVTVAQAASLNEKSVVTLSVDGYGTFNIDVLYNVSKEKPINVNDSISPGVKPLLGLSNELIVPVAVYGKTVPEPINGPDRLLDNNKETRYAQGEYGIWIEADLGSVQQIGGVALSFYDGNKRIANFELLYSEDGTNYKRVYRGKSSGITDDYEYYAIPESVRYIRCVGWGTTASSWFSLTEFRAFK